MKWSGLWELFRAYSEAPRQRSGSGPRYAIRATAARVLKKSGMDLGILLAATKFMSVCPRLPHPKAGTSPMSSIIMATTIQDGEANALDRVLPVAFTRVLPVVMRTYAAEMYRIASSLARNSKHRDANVRSLRFYDHFIIVVCGRRLASCRGPRTLPSLRRIPSIERAGAAAMGTRTPLPSVRSVPLVRGPPSTPASLDA